MVVGDLGILPRESVQGRDSEGDEARGGGGPASPPDEILRLIKG